MSLEEQQNQTTMSSQILWSKYLQNYQLKHQNINLHKISYEKVAEILVVFIHLLDKNYADFQKDKQFVVATNSENQQTINNQQQLNSQNISAYNNYSPKQQQLSLILQILVSKYGPNQQTKFLSNYDEVKVLIREYLKLSSQKHQNQNRDYSSKEKQNQQHNQIPASEEPRKKSYRLTITEDIHNKNYNLNKNPYLKMMFRHFCQQNVSKGNKPTFDQISHASQVMNLNKWMVFSKQFGFLDKFSKAQLMDCFKNANQNYSEMTYDKFVYAVRLLQNKLKISQKQLIKDVFSANNQKNYRKRLQNLKIQYFGPRRNFFVQSQIKMQDKINQEYYIPVKGMSQEHMMQELKFRKNQRIKRKNKNNEKMSIEKLVHYNTTKPKKINLSFIGEHSSYSKVFRQKTKKANTASTQQSQSYQLNHILRQAKQQISNNSHISASRLKYENQRLVNSQLTGSRNHEKTQIASINEQFQHLVIDSDAQSDQLLREHYKSEKRNGPDIGYSRLIDQLYNQKTISDDDETNIMITQYR